MGRRIVLLRGVNLGPRNRVAMPKLREALGDAGFGDVRTYVQSGNVVLDSDDSPEQVRRRVEALLADRFDLEVAVLVRTRDDLARVVEGNPLAEVADDPKRYQVTFLARELPASAIEELAGLAADGERLVADGLELYAWHPAGIARSKLWNRLASPRLGAVATARNWTTVTKLLELADERR